MPAGKGTGSHHFRTEKQLLIIRKRANTMAWTPPGATQPARASCSLLWPGQRVALVVKRDAKPQAQGQGLCRVQSSGLSRCELLSAGKALLREEGCVRIRSSRTGLPCTRAPTCCPDGLCCPAKVRKGGGVVAFAVP